MARRRRPARRRPRVRRRTASSRTSSRPPTCASAASRTSSRSTTSSTRSSRWSRPRPLRTSPFHDREVDLGARFLEGSGWERPHWFEANAGLLDRYGDRIPERGDWASRYWSPIAGAEALATRDGVALYDMTVAEAPRGHRPGALAFLDAAHHQPPRPAGRQRRLHAAARRGRRHPQRPDDRPARAASSSRSAPTATSTSTWLDAPRRRTTAASWSATSRPAPAASACGGRGLATCWRR